MHRDLQGETMERTEERTKKPLKHARFYDKIYQIVSITTA